MTELDKLEEYLIQHNFTYSRDDCRSRDSDGFTHERHQIIVYDNHMERSWDAICHPGSYGYEMGLLEVMGSPLIPSGEVRGYMTAEDVINRIRGRKI